MNGEMNGEGIETLGKDLFLASSESDQSEIQKTFRDPPPASELTSSYRDLGFRETFIADPEPGGTWSSGFGSSSDRRTLLPHERVHHPLPPDHLAHPVEIGHPGDHLGHLGHPSHPPHRLPPVGPSGQFPSPRIQLNPGFDSRCPS